MFIAMNRFRIAAGREADFIEVWRQRDSRLAEVPGSRPRRHGITSLPKPGCRRCS